MPEEEDVEIAEPVDSAQSYLGFRFESSVRAFFLRKDRKNRMRAYPVLLITPSTSSNTDPNKVLPGTYAYIKDPNNGDNAWVDTSYPVPGHPQGTTGLSVNARQMLWKVNVGTFPLGTALEMQRTPTTWKSAGGATAAGNTALWTPAGGKKFRLMGGMIALSKEAACAGAFNISFRDAAVVIWQIDISEVALVAIGAVQYFPITFPGNGYISTTADNVLNLNLGAVLTAGGASACAWGTEE